MKKKTVRDIDFAGKRVLMRVDFNVPLADPHKDENQRVVADDTRIRAALPTIQYVLEQKPKCIVLMSHLGRPKGQVMPEYSMRPVHKVLSELLDAEVLLAGDVIGKFAEDVVNNAPEGSVVLLQNTRYYDGETSNDPEFAAQLAQFGDVFVNDAFGTAHRAHASNVGVAQHLPAVAGFLMEKEIDFLSNALEEAERPFVGIMGGAKVSDKIKVIKKLLDRVDFLLVGGGIGITFLAAQGYDVQKSLVDKESLEDVKALLESHGDKIVVPTEVVVAEEFAAKTKFHTVHIEEGVPEGWEILDIGKESIERFVDVVTQARTVFWNGPLGVFEFDNFATGTLKVAEALEKVTEAGGVTIIGGGDSAAAVEKLGLADKMTHISTGGGASLKLVEGETLPGLESLADA